MSAAFDRVDGTTSVFAIFDKKSLSYFGIELSPNPAVYTRRVSILVNHDDPQNLMHHHSSDFELWKLADFDEKSGKFFEEPEYICSAADLLRKEVSDAES